MNTMFCWKTFNSCWLALALHTIIKEGAKYNALQRQLKELEEIKRNNNLK